MPLRLKMSQASFASARVTQRRDSAGSRSWAKLQKAQRALQALVMEKWQTPGPPSHRVSRAILTTERGFGAALPIAPLPSHTDSAGQACPRIFDLFFQGERCFDAGFDDFVLKPVDPARVTQILADRTAALPS
jgi:CheY-like chemotaxis protein